MYMYKFQTYYYVLVVIKKERGIARGGIGVVQSSDLSCQFLLFLKMDGLKGIPDPGFFSQAVIIYSVLIIQKLY